MSVPTRPTPRPRKKAARSATAPRLLMPADAASRLALALGASLLVSAFLQFVTSACDRLPALAYGLMLMNVALALALLVLSMRQRMRVLEVGALAGLVVAGAIAFIFTRAGFASARAGSADYAPPHGPLALPDAQEVRLRAVDGTPLAATYLGHGSGVGLVVVPGFVSGRKGFAAASLAEWLAPRFDVLVLDQRGTGDSGGSLGPDLRARMDVDAAVAWLEAKGDRAVGVLAEQEAALAALAAATQGAHVRSLALVSPAAEWGDRPAAANPMTSPRNPLGRLAWRVGAGIRLSGGKGPAMADLLPRAAGIPILLMGPRAAAAGRLGALHQAAPEPRGLRLFTHVGSPVAWADYQDYAHTVSQWFALTLAEQDARATLGASGSVPVTPDPEDR